MHLSQGNPFKTCAILKHTTKNSAEQTVMRTKWFKHIAIWTVQAHLLFFIKTTSNINLRTRFLDLTKQQQHNTRYVTKNPYFSSIFRHYTTKEAMQMTIQAGASCTPPLFFSTRQSLHT